MSLAVNEIHVGTNTKKEDAVKRSSVNPWQWSLELGYNQAELVEGQTKVLLCAGQTSVDGTGAPQHSGENDCPLFAHEHKTRSQRRRVSAMNSAIWWVLPCTDVRSVPYPVPPARHSLHLCRGDLGFRDAA